MRKKALPLKYSNFHLLQNFNSNSFSCKESAKLYVVSLFHSDMLSKKGETGKKNTLISFTSIMDDLREHFKVKEGGKGSETFLATYLKGFQPFLFLDAFRKQKFLLSSLSSFYCLKK